MAEAITGAPTQIYHRNIGVTAKNSGVHAMWEGIRDLHVAGYTTNQINYWLWSLDVVAKGVTTVTW